MEIQDLEERLICLKEKYSKLLLELEKEREYIMVSDETGNFHDLKDDLTLIKRQIESTQNSIHAYELLACDSKYTSATVGSKIKLENHELCLTFHLVPESEASPLKGLISISSPLGQAVLDKKEGDLVSVISPKGLVSYKIKDIA